MPVKDYYQVLEIPYNATELEIKKAYRKLAMRYHPDKNTGNPLAIQHFREIQEAYDILSNPVKRSEYHQIRWQHEGFQNRFVSPTLVTPELLLQEAKKINRLVSQMDVFRMNQEALHQELSQLMNSKHCLVLQDCPSENLLKEFILSVLKSMNPLKFHYWRTLIPSLVKIAGINNQLLEIIYQNEKKKKKEFLLMRLQPLIILLTVALICILIYLIA
ncbi:DnaJ domain-containing protein [Flavihumibacter sp. UBA7668]|uniref:DnaJ domain-containing protein n=1 Tax=Flavihumibacter sp. UBA7668 TaxID=1946542 RepID=UPI0025C62DA3|nr:DnaJ domain-containing protein [Flavihumibacter sp. UBA7668]